MQTPFILLLLLIIIIIATSSTARPLSPTSSLIASSCSHTQYPSLCIRTLSPSSPHTTTDLAIAAVSASLTSLHTTISSLHLHLHPSPLPGPLRDCFQQLSDSMDQLSKTKAELDKRQSETSRWQLDNACTWVSAALTNEDTCLDGVKGLGDDKAKSEVNERVREVEKMTSNALYFVTHLASSDRGKN